jgi:DNA-binding NarL/FixJ family response regulator
MGTGLISHNQHTGSLIADHEWPAIARRLHLSPQQTRIARLIIEEDLSNDGIAHRLGHKNAKGVEEQLERMFKKVGVRSRVGLVVRVFATQKTMSH